MALVSIFMCTYNRAHLLNRCIQSVLSQTFKDFEFVIANDASTDNTQEVLEGWAEKDKRIKVIQNKENSKGNLAKIKNPLILASSSKYIGHMDDDDFLYPTSLEERVKCMEENPSVEMCYHDIIRVDKKGRKWYWDCSKGKPFPNILPTGILQRAKRFKELGGWDLNLPVYHGELDYYIKIDWKIKHIPAALAEALISPTSQSSDRLQNTLGLEKILAKHKGKFTKKEISEYYAQMGLHNIEGGLSGSKYFVKSLRHNPVMLESLGGLLLGWNRPLFLKCYKVYRRLLSYDKPVRY